MLDFQVVLDYSFIYVKNPIFGEVFDPSFLPFNGDSKWKTNLRELRFQPPAASNLRHRPQRVATPPGLPTEKYAQVKLDDFPQVSKDLKKWSCHYT